MRHRISLPEPVLRISSLGTSLLAVAVFILWMGGWGYAPDLRRALIALLLLSLGADWMLNQTRTHVLYRVDLWITRTPARAWTLLTLWWLTATSLSVAQATALRTPLYDVGIFHQIIHSVASGAGYWSSVSKAGNFLFDHFSPTLALLAPAFWLSSSHPLTLPLLQPLILAVTLGLWTRFAQRRLGVTLGNRVALALMAFGSLWSNLRWGFHESSLAFLFLTWAFTTPSPFRRAVALILAALTKEILLLSVAFFVLVWGWDYGQRNPRQRTKARALALFAATLLVAGFVVFQALPKPADKNYFERYYSYLGHGLGPFLQTLFSRPSLVIEALGWTEILGYPIRLLLPMAFLPVLRPSRWLWVALPSFAATFLSTYAPLKRIEFHYALELWPVLFYVAILAIPQLPKAIHSPHRWTQTWLLVSLFLNSNSLVKTFQEDRIEGERLRPVRTALMALPKTDSVGAHELVGTWAASRALLFRWPDATQLQLKAGRNCPDWVVGPAGKDWLKDDPYRCWESGSYQSQWELEGWLGARRKPES